MGPNKIAILHTGFSVRDKNAAHRIGIAAERLGIEAEVFEKSEDIPEFGPDFIIALSGQDAKLTPFPTYGLIDSPISSYERAIRLVRNVTTYDAYLTPSVTMRKWVGDICFGAHKQVAPIAFFTRTAQMTEFKTGLSSDAMLACYLDDRNAIDHKSAIIKLSHTRQFKLYGPADLCAGVDSQAYFGEVPPDGVGMIERFHNAGIGLSLSNWQYRAAELPPEELFEIIASGAIAICAHSPWIEKAFGDSVLYVDGDRAAGALAAEILGHISWVRNNYEQAQKKAFEAHAILQKHYSLERQLMNVIELHKSVLVGKGYIPASDEDAALLPSVSYIMRTGSGSARPLRMIRRALQSLVAQNYPKITVVFVLHAQFPGLEDLMRDYPSLTYKIVRSIGAMRSTAIVNGIKAVETDLFGLLDDDDEFHPNHVRMLVKTLRYHDRRDLRGDIGIAYAGSVDVMVEGDYRDEKSEWQDQFMLTRKQRYCIEHFRWYTSTAMSEYRFFLMSNSWLARKSLVNDDVLDDPMIDTCEDLYLVTQLAQLSHLAFSCELTAIHHYHGHGNSTILDKSKHWPDTQRMARRAWRRTFPGQLTYHNPGFSLIKETVEGDLPIGANFLPRMSHRQEGEPRTDIVHFNKYVPTGVALFGPYSRLLPGFYEVVVFVEYADLDADASIALRLDVVCEAGGRLIAEKEVSAHDLRRMGRLARIGLEFSVSHQLSDRQFEFRLWRQTLLSVDVLRIVIDRKARAGAAEADGQDANVVKSMQVEAALHSTDSVSTRRKDLSRMVIAKVVDFFRP